MILKRALNPDAARYGDWLVYDAIKMRIIEAHHGEASALRAAGICQDHTDRNNGTADYQVINRSSVTIT